VLLYQVVKCRNSKRLSLEKQMRNVFDQHTEMDHDGIITGGKGKLFCLRDGWLSWFVVYDLVDTPCKDIIEDLRALFHDLYCHIPADAIRNPATLLVLEAKRKQDPRVQEATKNLSSSEWILEIINRYLSSKWDVDDDGSLYKAVLHPNSAASRDRRKRKAEDSNEEKTTYNERRRGRLPLRSAEPSRNTVWSQGTHSHANSLSGTLLGSSSRSATRVSTRSQSLRSYSRGSKAMSRGR
jgi:hypothetical protein